MPYGDRMSYVHGGKATYEEQRRMGRSELPRLSRVLADHFNNSMADIYEDAERDGGLMDDDDYNYGSSEKEEFHMKHSLPSYHPYAEHLEVSDDDPVQPEDAFEMLEHYRAARNKGEDVSLAQDDIREAFANRHDL